jgi:threonine aldolase
VYDPEVIREIGKICHRNDMYLHMDGARISNAAVSLGTDLRDITAKLGVDILSLGGTKNGLMFGEVVVVWDAGLAAQLTFAQKQGMQLASKMRFIAAQFAALFGTDLWRENARHANELAADLARRLAGIPGVDVVYPVEANGVFAKLPPDVISQVQKEIFFYTWDPDENIVRFMVSFDSKQADVEALEAAIRRHTV